VDREVSFSLFCRISATRIFGSFRPITGKLIDQQKNFDRFSYFSLLLVSACRSDTNLSLSWSSHNSSLCRGHGSHSLNRLKSRRPWTSAPSRVVRTHAWIIDTTLTFFLHCGLMYHHAEIVSRKEFIGSSASRGTGFGALLSAGYAIVVSIFISLTSHSSWNLGLVTFLLATSIGIPVGSFLGFLSGMLIGALNVLFARFSHPAIFAINGFSVCAAVALLLGVAYVINSPQREYANFTVVWIPLAIYVVSGIVFGVSYGNPRWRRR
jgi:hypothetical protein